MTSAAERLNDAPLPRSEFEKLRENFERMTDRIEDLEDALVMRGIEDDPSERDYLPIELVDRLLAGEHPVRVWREHRGLSVDQLADRAGMRQADLVRIEASQESTSIAALASLADALGLDLDDVTPRADAI